MSAVLSSAAPTVRVKAANVYGVWNEEGATLRLTISPPWWKTTWAYVFYIVGLGLLIVSG